MTARAIRYQRRGFRSQLLLTSLLDPSAYPAAEIAQLYHERRELELGLDEVKTHTLEREEATTLPRAVKAKMSNYELNRRSAVANLTALGLDQA